MLKIRLIPILTFNGVSLVKTKQFFQIRTVGNPIQAARIYNSRNVDELVFVDIKASEQKREMNLSLVKKVIDECFMPVTIGGGIKTHENIQNLLRIGADKVLIKSKAITNPKFIADAVEYFGSQCISIAVDVIKKNNRYFIHHSNKKQIFFEDFIQEMDDIGVGEMLINAVHRDGMMNGFDTELYLQAQKKTHCPLVAIGGAGQPSHFTDLMLKNFNGGLAGASIFHFTQFTPQDVKIALKQNNFSVRI